MGFFFGFVHQFCPPRFSFGIFLWCYVDIFLYSPLYFPFGEIKRVLDLNSTWVKAWYPWFASSSQGPGPSVPCSRVPGWCSEGVVAPRAATRTTSPSASQPRPLQAEPHHPFYILHILLDILQLWKPNATKSHFQRHWGVICTIKIKEVQV